jgi:phage head maturation protease
MKFIEGYAVVFGEWYETYDKSTKEFYNERLLPESCTQEFINRQIVFARLQHNSRYILGSNFTGRETLERNVNGKTEKYETGFCGDGKLQLIEDAKGLYYIIEADEQNLLHRAVIRMIADGTLKGSSTARLCTDNDSYTEQIIKGKKCRTFTNLEMLNDISPCKKGANPLCTVEVREFDQNYRLVEKANSYERQLKLLEDYEFQEYYKKLQKDMLPQIYK